MSFERLKTHQLWKNSQPGPILVTKAEGKDNDFASFFPLFPFHIQLVFHPEQGTRNPAPSTIALDVKPFPSALWEVAQQAGWHPKAMEQAESSSLDVGDNILL